MSDQSTSDGQTREERARAALAGRTRRQVSLAPPNTSVPVSYNSTQAEQENTETALPQGASETKQPSTAPATPQPSVTGEQQLDAVLPQQPHKEVPPHRDTATEGQGDDALGRKSSTESTQRSDMALPSSGNVSAAQHHRVTKPQQVAALTASGGIDEAALPNAVMLPSQDVETPTIHRDIAISHYRDGEEKQQGAMDTRVQEYTSPGQSGSTPVEPESSDTAELEASKTVVSQNTGSLKQGDDETMTEQRIITETVQSDNEALLEGEAEALTSMLASVPEDAVAQLMQALLVQPKVNKLNAAAWRSGGMQVTHGTHKSYKLLAGQYGVHMRDIVEQTLKACLPIWRARLKQLREEGVLGEEEEEELND